MKPVISTPVEISEERRSPGELSGEIELSGVVFRYAQGGPKVLDDISLIIAPGDYVAIVGPSGSGKSSLFRLLLGFERAEAGTVFYDGKALNTLDISAVRRQLGVVLQDTKLATGSLYDNICGGIDLPLEKAWEAARLAALDADIAQMPMGMHTLVAEGVSTLSGGQRQRLLIARALARSPRILLFDEATSALDKPGSKRRRRLAATIEHHADCDCASPQHHPQSRPYCHALARQNRANGKLRRARERAGAVCGFCRTAVA
ncbi:ATP-binding cassette domain-containing protein [Bradyrhizobium sp. UFLA05-109]